MATTTEPTQEQRVINTWTQCVKQKPWIVTVNSRHQPHRRVYFLKAQYKRRVVTTWHMIEARGFNTEQEARAWVDTNWQDYGLLVFDVANRREYAEKMLTRLGV